MKNEIGIDSKDAATQQQNRSTKHPMTTKPPYYHRDTKTHQEEVGRLGHRLFLRPFAYVFRFADAHNGFITGVATVILAYLTYSLASDSAKQAENAARQLDIMRLDERPWISIQALPTPAAPFITLPGDIYLTGISLNIKNVGKSPARMVNIYGRLITENIAAVQGLYGSLRRICDPLRSDGPLPEGAERMQSTVFSGESYSQFVDLTNLNNMADPHILKDNVFIAAGCIDYKFFGQPEHHQTAFVYDLRRTSGKPFDLTSNETIATDDLRWTFDMGGNGPAD